MLIQIDQIPRNPRHYIMGNDKNYTLECKYVPYNTFVIIVEVIQWTTVARILPISIVPVWMFINEKQNTQIDTHNMF